MQCVKGGVTTTFAYGADGLRRSMQVGSDPITRYLLDGQSVVQELRNGSAVATYLSGPRGIEYRQDSSGVRSWYLYDGLGSVIAEVDEGDENSLPEITATRTYDVYGAQRSSSGSSASNHKFVGGLGHTADDSTGLTYMRARYYDPAIGRFVSEDPKQNGGNWFVYCQDSPTRYVDSMLRDHISGCVGRLSGPTRERSESQHLG